MLFGTPLSELWKYSNSGYLRNGDSYHESEFFLALQIHNLKEKISARAFSGELHTKTGSGNIPRYVNMRNVTNFSLLASYNWFGY